MEICETYQESVQNIKEYPIDKPFRVPFDGVIRGFGEVYEIMSVEKLRRHLNLKYGNRYKLILAEYPFEINCVEKGVVDNPPWECSPRQPGNYRKLHPVLKYLSAIVFCFLIYLEPLWGRFKRPHLFYAVVRK